MINILRTIACGISVQAKCDELNQTSTINQREEAQRLIVTIK